MNDFRQFSTERLSLRAVRARDANQIFWLNSDPRVWAHRPSGVHTSMDQTESQVTGYIAAWDRDGLGCWAARTHDGTFIGIGGCSVKDDLGWNVYYRFLPEVQGRGYEAELVRAAVIAASVVRPELPIVALVLEHNAPSRVAAEHAGLTEVWRGPEQGTEDAPLVRLVYADRELPPGVVETLQAHSRPRPADPPQQARAAPDPVRQSRPLQSRPLQSRKCHDSRKHGATGQPGRADACLVPARQPRRGGPAGVGEPGRGRPDSGSSGRSTRSRRTRSRRTRSGGEVGRDGRGAARPGTDRPGAEPDQAAADRTDPGRRAGTRRSLP